MLKSTDLRRGNYASFYGKPVKCDGITETIFYFNDANGNRDGYSWAAGEGIELTRELLLKNGAKSFEPTHYSYGFLFKANSEFIGGDPKPSALTLILHLHSLGYFYYWIGYERKIKYVHELQNLYFALTGKELQITL